MLPFVLKSTIILAVLYLFYHVVLRDLKILAFNRFYLLTSLVLSVCLPVIKIPVRSDYIFNSSIERFNFTFDNFVTFQGGADAVSSFMTFTGMLLIVWIVVSLFFLLRYLRNLLSIAGRIRNGAKESFRGKTLVLIEEPVLPHSFFSYIFINRDEFEKGRVAPGLIHHEEAHCEQYHSLDIMFIELLIIFFWFNPLLWFFRKEIVLNHEYSADNTAVTRNSSTVYQEVLLNTILRDNPVCLVSNFKISLIKKRIIMMKKNKPLHNALLKKAGGISLFILLGVALTFCRENINQASVSVVNSEDATLMAQYETPDIFPVKNSDFQKLSVMFGKKMVNPFTKEKVTHNAIDIRAEKGTDVMASAGGIITKATTEDGFGNVIVIDHGNGYQTLYGHLNDMIIREGDIIRKAQVIGHVGSTGLSTGPHLHFEIVYNGERINPMSLLNL